MHLEIGESCPKNTEQQTFNQLLRNGGKLCCFYWILLPIVWPLLHILWRIEVVGKENIPRGRAHVIASNHLSDLDPVYILEAVFSWKRYTILAKQELFKIR